MKLKKLAELGVVELPEEIYAYDGEMIFNGGDDGFVWGHKCCLAELQETKISLTKLFELVDVEKVAKMCVGIFCKQDNKLNFPDRGHYNYECLENEIANAIVKQLPKCLKGDDNAKQL